MGTLFPYAVSLQLWVPSEPPTASRRLFMIRKPSKNNLHSLKEKTNANQNYSLFIQIWILHHNKMIFSLNLFWIRYVTTIRYRPCRNRQKQSTNKPGYQTS